MTEPATVTNIDRCRQDLGALLDRGRLLLAGLAVAAKIVTAAELEKQLARRKGDGAKPSATPTTKSGASAAPAAPAAAAASLKLPDFRSEYEQWYSKALAVVAQLLPDRVEDFKSFYKSARSVKELTASTYTLSDYAVGLTVSHWDGTHTFDTGRAAYAKFAQQFAILESAQARFDTSLFDIKAIVQADVYDSELDAARGLLKAGFRRPAGALAGVVLEKHLGNVASSHNTKVPKRPTLGDYNEALRAAGVYDLPTWRKIQHLTDLRNLCDHAKDREPTIDEVGELIDGIARVLKTIF